MAVDLAELGLSVESDGTVVATDRLDRLEAAAKRAETATERLEKQAAVTNNTMKNFGIGLQVLGAGMSVFITAPMIAAGFAAIRLATEAAEVADRFDSLFRGSIERSTEALTEMHDTIPLTITEMKGLASVVQDMLVPLGMARGEAAEFSVTALELAGDIAAFKNVGIEEVMRGIGSALAGQATSLRQYGIDIRQSRLENLALEAGLIGVGEEMDRVTRAQAVLIAITRDTADAMGAAEKGMNSAADRAKFLRRDLKEIQEAIGRDLLPVWIEFLSHLQKAVKVFTDLTPEARELALKIAVIVGATGPLLVVLGGLVRTLGFVGVKFNVMAASLVGVAGAFVTVGSEIERAFTPGMEKVGRATQVFNIVSRAAIILRETLLGIGEVMLGLGVTIIGGFRTIIGPVMQYVGGLAEAVKAAMEGNLAGVKTALVGIPEAMRVAFNDATAQMERGVGFSFDSIKERIKTAVEDVNELHGNLLNPDKVIANVESLTGLIKDFVADVLVPLNTATGDGLAIVSEEDIKAFQNLKESLDDNVRSMRELAEARALLERMKGSIGVEEYERWSAALKKAYPVFNALTDKLSEFRTMNKGIARELQESFAFLAEVGFQKQADEMQKMIDALKGGEEAWRKYQKEMFQAQKVAELGSEATADQISEIERLAGAIYDLQNPIEDWSVKFERVMDEWFHALNELSGLFEKDSREAEALNTVIQALNVVMGIYAVIKQLSGGDVWSAIPRALGVAAMIASMGVSTGASGSSANRRTGQEMQGTGGVLGDAEEKTESILKALEITADATSELVGINRGMLHALQAMQAGIEGATVQLARGAGSADFGALPNVFKPSNFMPGSLFLGKIFDKIFGGSAKLIDSGVALLGGTIDEIMFQAFQTVKVKKSIFSSSKIKESFQDLDEELSGQFGFILDSIVDTVTEAAKALGIPLDVIEARIASFEIAAQKISLKDLTAEEARGELLAVFGEIFDDLALHVVPFIDQFQKVGEGLGETLVRVATSVQVFQEAVKALGLSVDTSDPEAFAQMAVGIVELTGGVENFLALFSTFFDKFASDERKLAFSTDQLTRAFASVGLTLPATRDGMFELMQSLDASTEAGQRQIAMLLNSASAADEYYSLLEAAEEARMKALAPMEGETSVDVFTRLASGLFDAMAAFDGTPEQLIAIADAFGTVQQAGINAIAHINAAWESMTATIDRLRQDTLDIIKGPKSDRDIFVEAAGLVDQVKMAKTPEEIARITERFDALIRQLPPETVQRLGSNLLSLIDKFQAAADTSFEAVRDLTMDAIQSVNAMADAFLLRIPDALLALVSSNERVALMLENMSIQTQMAPGSVNSSLVNDGSLLASQNQILLDGANRMTSALQSGVRDLQNNVAGAVQSGLSNARVVVHVHMNNRKGLTTQ